MTFVLISKLKKNLMFFHTAPILPSGNANSVFLIIKQILMTSTHPSGLFLPSNNAILEQSVIRHPTQKSVGTLKWVRCIVRGQVNWQTCVLLLMVCMTEALWDKWQLWQRTSQPRISIRSVEINKHMVVFDSNHNFSPANNLSVTAKIFLYCASTHSEHYAIHSEQNSSIHIGVMGNAGANPVIWGRERDRWPVHHKCTFTPSLTI